MSQTRAQSAMEALCGTATGFALSLLLQQLLFPVLGHPLSLNENLVIALAFTLLSAARSFIVRRLFNRLAQGGV